MALLNVRANRLRNRLPCLDILLIQEHPNASLAALLNAIDAIAFETGRPWARPPLLLMLGFRQHIAVARHPHIQGRQQVNAQDQRRHQPAYDHDRKGPLRIRANPAR